MLYKIEKPEGMDEMEFKKCIASYIIREQLKRDFSGVAS